MATKKAVVNEETAVEEIATAKKKTTAKCKTESKEKAADTKKKTSKKETAPVADTAQKEVENPVKKKLQALAQIQDIDCQIDEINRIKGELPEEIKNEEDEIEGLRTRVSAINNDIDELTKMIANDKGRIDQLKVTIKKYEEQKNTIRNDRELISLENEIEAAELDCGILERHIKGYTAQIKDKKQIVEDTEEEINGREADLATKKNELSVIESEKSEELKALETKSEELRAAYQDKRLLDAYTRIRRNARNGLAVVPVCRDACGGCFNHIPPQRKIDIVTAKKIIVCEYCGRILVSDDII